MLQGPVDVLVGGAFCCTRSLQMVFPYGGLQMRAMRRGYGLLP